MTGPAAVSWKMNVLGPGPKVAGTPPPKDALVVPAFVNKPPVSNALASVSFSVKLAMLLEEAWPKKLWFPGPDRVVVNELTTWPGAMVNVNISI